MAIDFNENCSFVASNLSEASQWGQLVEELSEATAVAAKIERIVRKENPTPVSFEEALIHLNEELGDIFNCLDTLNLKPCGNYFDTRESKMRRWAIRIKEDKDGTIQ